MSELRKKFRYRSRKSRSLGLFVVWVGVFCMSGLTGYLTASSKDDTGLTGTSQTSTKHRTKRHVPDLQDVPDMNHTYWYKGGMVRAGGEELNCTPRSIEEFPESLWSLEERKDGWVVVHICMVLYTFAALAIVCDDYFVASLEYICDVLGLQPDVAGATFMAAGSSAPELFTSFIALFFADSDIGIGTIVGSAVFNILFIVGICGLGAGMVVYLTWWPLARDSSFYTLTVIALIVVIYDGRVNWYESVVFLVMYLIYVAIMYFNPRIGDYFVNKYNTWKGKTPQGDGTIKEPNVYSLEITPSSTTVEPQENGEASSEQKPEEDDKDEEEFESPLWIPDGFLKKVFWGVMLPMTLLFYFTVPDCRRPGCWKKLYMLTFINSIIWISALSYLMVWMVAVVGDTFDIPDTVMGLTLLAAGTSIPDALSSLFVARDGFGDMAVSNTIGSNVFDILIGLGLPWFIQTVIVDFNDVVIINSAALTFSAASLLATVVFLIAAIIINKWRLTRALGGVCLIVYVVFLVFACLYELNVFSDINLPACPRE